MGLNAFTKRAVTSPAMWGEAPALLISPRLYVMHSRRPVFLASAFPSQSPALQKRACFGKPPFDLCAQFAGLLGGHALFKFGEQLALFFVDVGFEQRAEAVKK